MDPWMEVVLFLTLVGVFVATAWVTLRGVTGRTPIPHRYLGPLVAAFLLEGAAVVFSLSGSLDAAQGQGEDGPDAELREARLRLEAVDSVTAELAELRSAHRRALDRVSELEGEGAHFLVRMVRFHRSAQAFGGSLNLTYPPDPRKVELARELQELLGELGHYSGPLDGNPERTKDVLIAYQQYHGFARVGWYGPATFDRMIADHLTAEVSSADEAG